MDGDFVLRFAGAIIGFASGGVYLKKFADFGQPHDLAISLAAYLLANLLFIEILRRGLGFGMILSSMGQLILMIAIGALLFGEKIGPMQGVGVALAMLAIAAFAQGGEAQ